MSKILQRKKQYKDCSVWLCPICDAEIDPWVNIMDNYTYKHYKGVSGDFFYFCSWTCMRKWERITGYKPIRNIAGRKKKNGGNNG